MRVVSLLPSGTEIVCAIGAGGFLVGRSHECDFPPSVRALPVLTAPQISVDKSSAEIDREVKARVARALSIYEVDGERLRALRPDLVITQTQCEVCAVSASEVEQALGGLLNLGARVISLQPSRLEEIFGDILRVGQALGCDGAPLVAQLRARIAALQHKSSPRVACIEWLDPLMGAGHWMPELVALAGGVSLFGEIGARSPWITWEALAAARPEVVVVAPCGFDLARTRREVAVVEEKLRSLGARVVLADGNAYFNRSGPRIVDSVEILADIFDGRPGPWEPL